MADRQQAQSRLDNIKGNRAQGDSKAPDDDVSAAAEQVLGDGLKMNKMETDAKENDPDLATAREKLESAKRAMDAFKSQIDAALQSDAEYQAAQQQLVTAQQAVTSRAHPWRRPRRLRHAAATPPKTSTPRLRRKLSQMIRPIEQPL